MMLLKMKFKILKHSFKTILNQLDMKWESLTSNMYIQNKDMKYKFPKNLKKEGQKISNFPLKEQDLADT